MRISGFYLLFALLATLGFSSCDEKSVEQETKVDSVEIDSSKAAIVNVSGKLFSIPSPVQTALLIKQSETVYMKDSLNSPRNYSNYSTNSSKAMNLGIYGTEMAYSSLYDDGQRSLQCFKAIENLSNDLGIKAALNPYLIKRLGANVSKPDSLLVLSGRFYEEADSYLKENERYDIAALVLLGGWVEANYLTALSAQRGNEKAKKRLAEQKTSISTLIDVLKLTASESFAGSQILANLDSLKAEYDQISYSYTYVEPVTDAEMKTTHIRSKSEFQISAEQLNSVSSKLKAIRNEIIRS